MFNNLLMKKTVLLCLILVSVTHLIAQDYFPTNTGLKQENNNYTAFTNAVIYITPNEVIKNGTLLIQDGKVIASGKSVTIPKNAIIIDLNGKHIYPSFIDPYSSFGVSKPENAKRERSPQYETKREGFYWNDHIMPENKAIDKFKYVSKKADELRKAGFGVVNSHIMDGIARGTGVLVTLNDEGTNSERIINDISGQYFSFKKSQASRQSYPSSHMGSIALLKQFQHDAKWYAEGNATNKDLSLEAFNASKNLPSFIESGDKRKDINADDISDTFNLNYTIVGGGNEYEMIESIKVTQAKYIIPINFPEAYDVSDPYSLKHLTIEEMRDWNQAPTNLKVLADNNIEFALTTFKLKKVSEFDTNLKKAIKYGYDKTKALESLTTVPAAMLGQSDKVGTLKNGRYANFLITSGELFEEETILYENWVQGNKNVINSLNQKDIRGDYAISTTGKKFDISISGKIDKLKSEVKVDTVAYASKLNYKDDWVTLMITDKETTDVYNTTALIEKNNDNFSGLLILPSGKETVFTAIKQNDSKKKKDIKEDKKSANQEIEIVPLTYPNVGYGFSELPKQQTILFKNATVWTNEEDGILTETDVLVKNGKIEKIGANLSTGNALTIDATGKHLTSGVIDEHSHIAAFSINEGGQNSSAEVTIEDVLDPEDINIYRNLAGGVTTIQILHGSANPIGGRSAIIKPRWGADAQGLLYKDAPKFIKFALGENVKQSNWQSFNRFPQTRMGVEQLYINYFTRAQEYEAKKKSGNAYRYDEEMEVLVEILNSERFISCHSYVQSEINMLMKVAERFNFRINTFTHILEGYKVADKMKEHGVGASTFSDWWAYKYEVIDAIPYNATIMTNAGVIVAINSDDAEMSRRLNQEAAKSVKYGGMSEEDAWKMVTLNPAKLLHLDDKVGSVKVGKDADIVLWSDHPLSVYAKAEKTLIEGVVYFDMETDKLQRKAIQEEKNKLVNLMRNEKDTGGKKKTPIKKKKRHLTCESL
ncbi:MAG: imidazolonepropionase-like amidohydrolase [Flavobacteriaceae bacterium]|jgi:imidazolonepropionase-like amidohydrolase